MKLQNYFSRVVLLTITMLIVVSGFLFMAGSAQAAPPRDSLIKVAGPASTLYYYSNQGTRYVFPNEGVFYSWFTGFSNVYEVSIDELVTYPLAGNVTYRPGIRLVKIQTDPKVYAVSRGGVLRWLASESVAERLYGSDWNKKIDDVPDAFFVNYTIGDPIYNDNEYDPLAVATTSNTIGADKGLSVGSGPHYGNTVPDVGNAAQVRAMQGQSCQADTWTCGSWSNCTSGMQTRSCVKTVDCPGVDTPIPSVAQSCTASTPEPVSCTVDTWACTNWSECANGNQTRTCQMTYDCPNHATPSPATVQSCESVTEPFVQIELTSGVSSTTVSPGDHNVPMLQFEVSPINTDLRVFNIAAFGWIDANNDGIFSRTSEAGVKFSDVVEECAVYDGDLNIVGYHDVGETIHGEEMVHAPMLSTNYNIYEGESKTLTFKCNIRDTAGNHSVALVFETQDTIGGVQGSMEGAILTYDHESTHPINGNGVNSVGVHVTVEGVENEPAKPVVSLISLPSFMLNVGEQSAMRFSIAAPEERIAVRHLTFQVDLNASQYLSVATTAESSIRELGTASNIKGFNRVNNGLTCESENGSATTCVIEVGFDANLIIPAGDIRAFELLLDVDGSVSINDSMSTRMLADDTLREGRLIILVGGYDVRVTAGSPDNFVWYDMEGLPESQITIPDDDYHWLNGAEIDSIPTDYQVMAS